MKSPRASENLLAVVATVAAYALLYAAWISSREFAHTYQHWVAGIDATSMPSLSVATMTFIGLKGPAAWSVAADAVWIAAALWPACAFVLCLRLDPPSRTSFLALGLFAWLGYLLAGAILVAVGLWLPFSLL